MDQQQLELGLKGGAESRSPHRGERRIGRARWWFQQMHEAVDRALDWPAAAPTDSEAARLAVTRGETARA